MKKYIYILIILTIPQIGISQLHKCDSSFVSTDNKIHGGFKNGLEHGTWTYSADTMHFDIIKLEDYWFGDLVRESNSLIYEPENFEKNDSIIEYFFDPTIKFILSKTLVPDSSHFYYCELEKNCDSVVKLVFHKINVKHKNESKIDNFCFLTNRFIVLDSLNIPIVTQYDREFGNLGWVFTGCYLSMTLDKHNRIMELIKYGW